MGLIALGKNVIGMAGEAINTAFADSIKDYYRCDGMAEGILMIPGTRVVQPGARNPGAADVISDGSVFDVSIGQCAIVLENGAIHDMVTCYTDEGTGQYQFKSDRVASFFGTDKFSTNLKKTVAQIGERFTAGGQTTNTYRLLYINLRPLKGMKAGVGGATFRDVEMNITLQVGVHGIFSYSVADPITFFRTCINDPTRPFRIDSGDGANLHSTLKAELKSRLKSTFSLISQMNITYDQIQGNTDQFIESANKALGNSWSHYGIVLDPVGSVFEVDVDEDGQKLIKDYQRSRAYGSSEAVLRGRIVDGQLDAMNAAASNEGGATKGLMGMGIMGSMQNVMGTSQMVSPVQPEPQQPIVAVPPQGEQWICTCGETSSTKFCGSCGAAKPQPSKDASWSCSCGTENTMKFCVNCGSQRPESVRNCRKCGYEIPSDGEKIKFCPNCGNPLVE